MSVIAILVGCLMLFATSAAELEREAESDYSEGWTTNHRELVDVDDINTGDSDGYIVITKTLPDRIKTDDSLCFVSANTSITVYVQGHCEYRFSQPENFTGFGYGTAYHSVKLSPENEGETVKIVLNASFKNGSGGRIRMLSIEDSRDYFARLAKGQILPFTISVGIIIIGILLLIIRLILPRGRDRGDMVALGITAVITGVWLANDTGFFRMVLNAVIFCRVVDYVCEHILIFPLVGFVYSITHERRRLFIRIQTVLAVFDAAFYLIMRFVFGYDMTDLTPEYFVYIACSILLVIVMLFSDHVYCRKNDIESESRFFSMGIIFFLICCAIDIGVFASGAMSITGHAPFMRIGFYVFFITMGVETIRNWIHEQASIRRDRFINKMLQYAVSANDPDISIRAIMKYFGTEFSADHVYLYENRRDGTFHTTYEWFREGAPLPASDEYHDIPYEGLIDGIYDRFNEEHRLIIRNREDAKEISPALYDLLTRINIRNMVIGPLVAGGDLIGLFGIDDAPDDSSNEISDLIWLMSYFITQLIFQRDEWRNLERFGYIDSLTGAHNRRALDIFEKEHAEDYPYGFVMCDINGLKKINDTVGHDCGDDLIADVAACLIEVFGTDRVFRLGGDEFVAYSFAETEAEFDKQAETLRGLLYTRQRSASIGCVYVKDDLADRMKVKKRAEELMYAEKEEYYRGNNDRRRE